MDDMVAKIIGEGEHCKDLQGIFTQIRKFNMRLNPKKCKFGVRGGKFLGFLLTCRGIEANLEKCQVILEMRGSSSLKEVQQLTGHIATFSRFLARSAERAHSAF